MSAAAPIRRAAPAKLNLDLHVVGKRADGYHLLDSLVAFADVHDTVSAAPAPALSLEIAGPFAPALAGDGDNLVLRAARKLAAAGGVAPAAALGLVKRLPVASGIGGGSADAAAALLALRSLWRLELAPGTLEAIALSLGADVPICLAGRAARITGIGEIVSPVPALPEAPLVLVNPLVPLPTPAVFKARQGPFSRSPPFAGALRDARDLAEALAPRRNDLTDAAIGIVPAIAEILAALAAQPGCLLARMSGSGATCFALFAEPGEAAAAAAALARSRPGWWIKVGTLLDDVSALAPSSDPA